MADDKGRISGEIEPDMAAAIGAVANPDNWGGLDDKQKADLQAEIRKGLTKEQRRTVDALVAKQQRRGGRRG